MAVKKKEKKIRFKLVKVESGNVAKVGYNKEHKILAIVFLNKSRYHYKEVPGELFNNLKIAPSIGSYLNREVKGNFDYERIK